LIGRRVFDTAIDTAHRVAVMPTLWGLWVATKARTRLSALSSWRNLRSHRPKRSGPCAAVGTTN